MANKQIIGKFGETLAKNYLIRRGYKIIATNVKTSYKEIDIVAQSGGELIFVEVKTRTSLSFGAADEAMTPLKQMNFKKAIELFIFWRDISPEDIRADLIAIDLDRAKKTAKIKHYQDII